MKKIYILFIVFLLMFTFSEKVFGATDEFSQIDQLKSDRSLKREMINYQKIVFNIETTYHKNQHGKIIKKDVVLTDNELENKLSDYTNNDLDNNISLFGSGFEFDDGGGDAGGGIPDGGVAESKIDIDAVEYKKITIYGIYYASRGSAGEYNIKVTVEWLTEPINRLTDVLTLKFSDDLLLKNEYIDGQNYPSITSTYSYLRSTQVYYISGNYSDYSEQIEDITYGNDTNFLYDTTDHIIRREYILPTDFTAVTDYYTYITNYENFKMEMEMNFFVTDSDCTGASFTGLYLHQITSGQIDWGSVSIISSPPFITYQTDLWENVTIYDEEIGGIITFQN